MWIVYKTVVMSLVMEQFVNSLSSNPHLIKSHTNVERRAALLCAQGLVSIVLGLVMIQFVIPKLKTLDGATDKLKSMVFYQKVGYITSGVMLLVNAIQLYYLYAPSNTEVSLAILIKYLKLEGIIRPEVYDKLKPLKPYRIETLQL